MSSSLYKLKQLIEQLENLEQQKTELSEDIRDILAGAKGEGFDIPTIKQVLKIRRMKPEEVSEKEELLHLYLNALRHQPHQNSQES
jgi:uncharacterized protein (UPF0335 family)